MADGNDDTNGTTPPASPPAAIAQQPAAAPDTVTMTRGELDALIKERSDSAAAAARRSVEGRLKPNADPPAAPRHSEAPAPNQSANVADQVARAVQRESAFTRAVTKAGLDTAQESVLRSLMSVEQVDDVGTWVTEKARVFGVQTQTNATPNHQPPAASPNPQANSVRPPPSVPPMSAVSNDGPDDVTTWNQDQVEAYLRKHGADPNRPYHPSNFKAFKELANKFGEAMGTKRVLLK